MKIERSKSVPFVDPDVNGRIAAIGTQIQSLQAELTEIRANSQDVFSPLGPHAPLVREILRDVDLPVKSSEELVAKAGGPDRIVVCPDLDGVLTTVAIADLLAIIGPFVDRCMPIQSWDKFVEEIRAMVRKAGEHVPLIRQIRPENLQAILADPERRRRAFRERVVGPHRLAYESWVAEQSEQWNRAMNRGMA